MKNNEFDQEVASRVAGNGRDQALKQTAGAFLESSVRAKYSYNFSWLGRPVIQYPQDLVALQEIIWTVQPRLIVETGIAHGGSLIFSASILELNAACGGPADAHVLGIDIDIRPHNREAIEAHPLARRISMLQGSSIAPDIIEEVKRRTGDAGPVLVCLDSNHTYEHVLAELHAYAPLATVGSYCIVFDTIVEDLPVEMFGDRPWRPGNSPQTAVREYVREHPEFRVATEVDDKILISVAPGGYLRRVS